MKFFTIGAVAAVATVASADQIFGEWDLVTPDMTNGVQLDGLFSDFNNFTAEFMEHLISFLQVLEDVVAHNEFIASFFETWSNYEVTTRHDTHEWAKQMIKPLPAQGWHHKHIMRGAHHRIRERRRANGRPDFPRPHEFRYGAAFDAT